jgi:hypothetical protein
MLALAGIDGSADLQVRDSVIEIRAVRRNPRERRADVVRRLAAQGGDARVWPEVANEGDNKLVWLWRLVALPNVAKLSTP